MTDHPATFICAECGQVAPWHDEETALAELARDDPGRAVNDCVMVCDDCYSNFKPEPT